MMMRSKSFLVVLALTVAPITAVWLQGSPADNGKKVYNQVCMACHGPEGKGIPGLNPPLIKTSWVTGDKKRLINVILKGLEEPITINGEEYSVPMQPQAQLSDQQIADVLTYIRSSFGNKASAITAAEVKAVRTKNG